MPEKSGHGWGWVFSILAVPLVYVLSVPVVGHLTGAGLPFVQPKPWFRVYSGPWYFLQLHTPLKDPLSAYDTWYWKRVYNM
ncbi:hypothetical protein [Roseimicrobium sp. ORNL1]|uniref:hypothetical protein n=1 Tax=Roseimicrobium sp. ORNL1 TaxID=2711231 RepID=UPI0013E15E42|nr:hypothetical protein [Roseimicrobium sp. ORNL1]QIF01940.1 hypothetical protein G5S37_10500 [Roseimicrobium sp. ORNL1]